MKFTKGVKGVMWPKKTREKPRYGLTSQKYYTNEKAYNDMNNCSDTSERKKGKQLDISAVDTSVDEISDDTAEKKKYPRKFRRYSESFRLKIIQILPTKQMRQL